MPWRTSEKNVQDVLGDNWDGVVELDRFILGANAVVTWLAGQDTDSVLTTTLLERIECYIAAHLYTSHDQLKASEKIGQSSVIYQGQFGKMLERTSYGQDALMFDVTGKLATMGKPKAKVSWLGLPPSDQTDYIDRD